MKGILFAFFSLVCVASAKAQIKTTDKAIVKVPTVACDACRDYIEFTLQHLDGVISAKVDIKKKTVAVTWLTDRTSIEGIREAIINIGYDADGIEAEPSAWRGLPKACKAHIPKPKS